MKRDTEAMYASMNPWRLFFIVAMPFFAPSGVEYDSLVNIISPLDACKKAINSPSPFLL